MAVEADPSGPEGSKAISGLSGAPGALLRKVRKTGSFLGPVFEHFLDHFWGHFGTYFGTRSGQEGAKMCPRGPSKTPKTQKVAFAKTLKNLQFFKVFGVQRPPQRALGGPRRLPRGSRRAPRPNKKGIRKWAPKLSIFGPILGPFWGPFWRQNWLQKGTKNGTTFGTLSLRISEVGGLRFCELNESAAKATGVRLLVEHVTTCIYGRMAVDVILVRVLHRVGRLGMISYDLNICV